MTLGDRKHLSCQPSLDWLQPHISTAGPGSHVCSIAGVSVRPSALRVGASVLPGGWCIFVWGFCVGFKSIYVLLEKEVKGAM